MDKISKKEFFSAILSSNILTPYLGEAPGLADLIKSPNHPDVHYFETPASPKELLPALKPRLNVMNAKNISHNLEATKQLVTFMEEHPESLIYNVTFNCPNQHYGVRCGLVDNHIHVICVMTGGRIPDTLLGESIQ
jgi:hypothetical protein